MGPQSAEQAVQDGAGQGLLARKLGVSVRLTRRERAALSQLEDHRQTLEAASDLLVEGRRSRSVLVLEAGWAFRYKLLPDGRRQILNFVLPGDMVGLKEHLFHVTPHSVMSLTEVTVSRFDPSILVEAARRFPKLTMALAWSASRDEAMLEEQIVRVGRRNAYERMAHLFLELLNRLQMVGLAGERSFELPMTQEILADTLGLSIVHVNRTLRRFRREGLIGLENGRIVLKEPAALTEIADFEGRYLNQRELPAAKRSPLLGFK